MSLAAYFEKVNEDTVRADLTPLLPLGQTLKDYALASSLPSQSLFFLAGGLGALSMHVFSVGLTDQNVLIIYDRMSKESQTFTPQTVKWVLWKKRWLNDTLTIALPNQSRIGLLLYHRSASLPNQAQQLEALRTALNAYPQKQTVHISARSWFKVFGVSFLLRCVFLFPIILSRIVSKSVSVLAGITILTVVALFLAVNKIFKYPPKMTSALAGTSYGVFISLLVALFSKSLSEGIMSILILSVLGFLFGYVFGFIYGFFTKQDYYQDFSA